MSERVERWLLPLVAAAGAGLAGFYLGRQSVMAGGLEMGGEDAVEDGRAARPAKGEVAGEEDEAAAAAAAAPAPVEQGPTLPVEQPPAQEEAAAEPEKAEQPLLEPEEPAAGPPAVKSYTYGSVIRVEEDREHEFKSLASSPDPRDTIARHTQHYVNAFLNSHGGTIYFGIRDDGFIHGLHLDRTMRDSVRLRIDGVISAFRPQVDPYLYSTRLVPVIKGPQEELFVIEIETVKGRAPVYFSAHGKAHIRRDGGCTAMQQEVVEQRLKMGRPVETGKQPAGLPPDFIGREKELTIVRRSVSTSAESLIVFLVSGPPFVGKSSFARQLLNELGSTYSDERYTIDLSNRHGGYVGLASAMASVIRVHFPRMAPGGSARQLKSIYDSCFRGAWSLLLIENAGSAEDIYQLLPTSKGRCCVVVTSRKPIEMSLARGQGHVIPLTLQPLSNKDAKNLLLRFLPQLKKDDHFVHQIVEACDYLPLVIRCVATVLRKHKTLTKREIMTMLTDHESNMMSELPLLRQPYNMLDPHSRANLCALSLFPASFDVAAAQAVLAQPYAICVKSLGELVDANMLEFDLEQQRYAATDMVRRFATGEARRRPADREGWRRRFCHYFLGMMRHLLEQPRWTSRTEVQRVLLERLNLSATLHHAHRLEDRGLVWVILLHIVHATVRFPAMRWSGSPFSADFVAAVKHEWADSPVRERLVVDVSGEGSRPRSRSRSRSRSRPSRSRSRSRSNADGRSPTTTPATPVSPATPKHIEHLANDDSSSKRRSWPGAERKPSQ